MKNKLAFIDHSYHRKTGATKFLIDILNEYYYVTFFWDNSWNGGKPVNIQDIARQNFKKILFFQIIHYPERDLFYLRENDVIVCPMFDASPHHSISFWNKFKIIPKIKFINFSKTLHEKFVQMGFPSFCIQYFPPPEKISENGIETNTPRGFFWQRTNQITWKNIRKLIKDTSFESFHIHDAVDPPGFRFISPTPKEKKIYNIQISKWLEDKKDLLKIIDQSDIYFSSRISEGIGQSFLEAMARGKCVVAPDRPTMNEYIQHGKTGLLYNPLKPEPIDFANTSSIGQNAYQYMKSGHQNWINRMNKILEFIQSDSYSPRFTPVTLKTGGFSDILSTWQFKIKHQIKKKFPKVVKIIFWLRKHYR